MPLWRENDVGTQVKEQVIMQGLRGKGELRESTKLQSQPPPPQHSYMLISTLKQYLKKQTIKSFHRKEPFKGLQ